MQPTRPASASATIPIRYIAIPPFHSASAHHCIPEAGAPVHRYATAPGRRFRSHWPSCSFYRHPTARGHRQTRWFPAEIRHPTEYSLREVRPPASGPRVQALPRPPPTGPAACNLQAPVLPEPQHQSIPSDICSSLPPVRPVICARSILASASGRKGGDCSNGLVIIRKA